MLWERYYVMNCRWRDALVRAVESSEEQLGASIIVPSVKDFEFAMMTPYVEEHEKLPDFLRQGNARHDPVVPSLQRLSRDCERLFLEGPVHSSLFDTLPTSADLPGQQGVWSKLRQLHVKFDIRGPHGKWYFGSPNGVDHPSDEPLAEISGQLPPGYGSTEEELQDAEDYYDDNFADEGGSDEEDEASIQHRRTRPVDAEINPLVRSFARACTRLPCLTLATLQTEYRNEENWPFQVICAAPGTSLGDWDSKFATGNINTTRRVYLHAEGGWRPDQETLNVLDKVGMDACGGRAGATETEVTFLPWGDFYL